MRFNEREWVNDLVTGAITGLVGGAVGALILPGPPMLLAIGAGGIVGFVSGAFIQPMKWLLGFLPAIETEEAERIVPASSTNRSRHLPSTQGEFITSTREGQEHEV